MSESQLVDRAEPAVSTAGDRTGADAGRDLLRVHQVSRWFGETRALHEASLTVRRGEIHSLAGENGSGKSTMMKMLSGVVRPHGGTVELDGEPVRFANPRAARDAGIATVFQETLVVPEASVRDNVFLGTDGLFRHGRRRRVEARDVVTALTQLGLGSLDPTTPVWQLSLAERQLVTIARAVVRPWRLLILDESTSALDLHQRDRLFAYLRASRAEGRSVLFTSHRMDEVEELADTVTVLRLGTSVGRRPMAETSAREILRLMAGRELAARVEQVAAVDPPPLETTPERPVLQVSDLVLRPTSQAFSLTVGQGEILGLAGLEGQGQVEFADCVAAITAPVSGEITVLGSDGRWTRLHGFADANRKGIAFVPRDRRHEGLFGPLSILDNFGFGIYPRQSRFGVVRRSVVRREFEQFATRTRLVHGGGRDTIGTLSGGNQQKVLLGRWLATRPRILVLNDPMRGVDANTKDELYGLLRAGARDGLAIVLVSTEIVELLTLCDRVAVFHEGGVEAVLPARGTRETDVMAAMFGAEGETRDDG